MLILTRICSSDKGTFGVISMNDMPLCATCEDPWNDNAVGNSCIPKGKYQFRKFSGTKFKDVWEAQNVPGRNAILIHAGNTIEDTHGCILVGRCFSRLGDYPAVLQSQDALTELRTKLPDVFEMEIR